MNRFAPAAAILAAALLLAPLAHAKTFRWASQGDILTMDPHSQNEALNNGVLADVYETLVTRDKQLKVVPLLAVSWTQPKPTVWRFVLRKDVKFHDGTPFTAEDVVFSIQRAQAPSSNFQIYTQGIDKVRKIDDYTVEIETKGPNPVLLDQLTELRVMSKAWAEKNKVTAPQNFIQKEETYSARNANGTGPYMLKSRETDVRTVFVVNPNWWGKREGNVTEVIYTPVKADATRVAALLSGELDFVLDPPPQDIARLKSNPNLRILEGNENRTIFLGMDQHRDELLYSDVKGKNPFKDKRVRQAIYHAIDEDAIQKNVMRGLALPTGSIVAPQVRGYSKELDKRLAHDKEKAKKLLAEAGYPNGFEVTLDCPNNRYINDERICQAVAGMLAQVGIRVKLNAMPRATYFPKIQKFDTSMYLLGWGVPTFDALYSLQSLARTVGPGGDGNFNLGRYSNPQMDARVERIKTETDRAVRDRIIGEALAIHNEDVAHVPLHHQVIPWAMRSSVSAVHRADNRVTMNWVTVK
ncbi:MAG: ABC transporter substrate-binding protein [Burkholderiales bacterium]|jgi:peptide/nickel transport system substrate-binding protein|nr:ABC transporter substrate-binding protein [Burkholderiales bacterium]